MSEFIAFLFEVFQDFGLITSRRLFGGFGRYNDSVMIGLVADDTLYLKTDKSTENYFIDKQLKPSEYEKARRKYRCLTTSHPMILMMIPMKRTIGKIWLMKQG